MNKSKVLSLILIAVVAVGAAYALSLLSADRYYSESSVQEELLSGEHDYIVEGASFDSAMGYYEPTGDDPWIAFSGLSVQGSGILITLKEAASTDVVSKLYYIASGEELYSEYHTSKGVIDKGQTTGYLKLPSKEIGTIRLDIDGACRLDRITILKDAPSINYVYTSRFWLVFAIQVVLIFAVLYFAILAHKERIAKGSRPIVGIFISEPKNPATYRYEYDWVRTLAAVMVIMMHSVVDSYAPYLEIGDPGYGVIKGVLALSLGCNALYIMLSGALLLKPSKESFRDFYIKRLGRVLIPTLSYFAFCVIWGYGDEIFAEGIGKGLMIVLKGLLSGRPTAMPHMWFIYAIIALYILTPFLRRIIEHISEGQLFGLILTGFVFDCFATYVPLLFGVEFGIQTPIASWLGLFLLGYYMTTEHASRSYIIYIILGVLGVGITIASVYYAPLKLYYESSWTPVMWLIGAGVFAFFSFFSKLFGRRNVVIASIAKYNFSIMLIHVLILFKVVLPIGWRLVYDYGQLKLGLIGMIAGCFALSYLFSLIYENTAIIAANYVYSKLTSRVGKSDSKN